MCPLEAVPSGSVTSPAGFRAGTAAAGLRQPAGLDIAILVSELPCSGAGVFTRNRVRAAPVLFDERLLRERPGRLRGVVMNAKYANACTGDQGLVDAARMAAIAEEVVGASPGTFLTLSTGVIGVPLPMGPVESGIREAGAKLHDDGGIDAARAIMTTDTRPKHTAVSIDTTHGRITVGGIAKGAGMIHPDMATLLGVITTDARLNAARLSAILTDATDRTFNAITVDGDTSTNDSVIILANGASEVDVDRDADLAAEFAGAVEQVARELALEIVRDGEGATKFVELSVTGASTESAARAIGRAVATSALVKTAFYGCDPNWGRILAAAGAAGYPLDPNRLGLEAQVRAPDGGPAGEWEILAREGAAVPVSEDRLDAIFAAPEIAIRLDLGVGGASSTVWTTDFSEDYIRINADYRT